MLEQYLGAFIHIETKLWGKYLHWVEWNYNSAKHSSIGVTPYEVVYNQPQPSLPQYVMSPYLCPHLMFNYGYLIGYLYLKD